MHNWHAVEVESEFRRLEWERAAAADARASLAVGERVWPTWLKLPRLSFSGLNLRRLPATAPLSFAAPSAASQTADGSC